MLSKTSTGQKQTRFQTLFGTGGSNGCNSELAKVVSIHNNEILWSTFCASFCSTLWVVFLILYLLAQPKITSWKSKSTDMFRPVVPGCRYINVSYVDYAGTYQHRTQTSSTDTASQIQAHVCSRRAYLNVEYPAEYGPFSSAIPEEGFHSGGVLPGATNPFPGGVTKTNTFHSGIVGVLGKKQCIYAKWFSLDRKKGPSMPGLRIYGYDTKDGKDEKCMLTEETVDNICALYPPPMNYSAHDLVPCWSGSGPDAFLCSAGADNADNEKKKCVTLTNPAEYVQDTIQILKGISTMWVILAIVAVLFHLMIIAVSYRYCWLKVRRDEGFWPGPAIGSCCTLACCLCGAVAVKKANRRCYESSEAASLSKFRSEDQLRYKEYCESQGTESHAYQRWEVEREAFLNGEEVVQLGKKQKLKRKRTEEEEDEYQMLVQKRKERENKKTTTTTKTSAAAAATATTVENPLELAQQDA